MSITIEAERSDDRGAIASLHHEAFAGRGVEHLVETLRVVPAVRTPISLVARNAVGLVIGHVMLSAGRVDAPARLVEVMTLSPLAVLRDHRRQGVGAALVAASLREADRQGVPLVFLEGDPNYYSKLGFRLGGPLGFRRPSLRIPEAAFQVALLSNYETWMRGTFVYSETFWALDCVGLR